MTEEPQLPFGNSERDLQRYPSKLAREAANKTLEAATQIIEAHLKDTPLGTEQRSAIAQQAAAALPGPVFFRTQVVRTTSRAEADNSLRGFAYSLETRELPAEKIKKIMEALNKLADELAPSPNSGIPMGRG